MYKNFLNKHFSKNLSKYILSNYIFLSKKLKNNKLLKSVFFYDNLSFFLSVFILFSFWFNNMFYNLKKNNIVLITSHINFFIIFSLFFYPSLFNIKIFNLRKNKLLYFTFIINRFIFNPFIVFLNKIYDLGYHRIFNVFKIYIFTDRKELFYLNFYLNFCQLPLFQK